MRILFVLAYALDRTPGQRYRVEQWIPHLRARGIECDVRPLLERREVDLMHSRASSLRKAFVLLRSLLPAARAISASRGYDAVWISRGMLLAGPAVLERILARVGPPMIFDFDDAIWIARTMDANRLWAPLKFAGRTATLCRKAAVVIAGNENLATYARAHNENVWVIPSTVDTDRYQPRSHEAPHNGPLIVGWSGSPTTVWHLELIRGALRRVAERLPIEVRVMGAEWDADTLPIVMRRWSPETEIEELRSFDIGVMPLFDDPFVRGKGAMKALLYMGVGVPTIASPVGITPKIIQDGCNGLLAATEDEWVEKLLALAESVELRQRLGRAGRATVEREYSAKVQVPRLVEALESVRR
jgi:glycosyltransferase involved in cell wall biosynthesis